MLSPHTRRRLYRLLPFALIWVGSGWVFFIVELAATDNARALPDTAIRVDMQIFIFSTLAMTAVGLLIGLIEIHYLSRVFVKKRFAVRLAYKLFIYSLLFLLVVSITYPVAASLELGTSITDHRVWQKYLHYAGSITHLSTGLQLAASLLLALFYTEISEFIGHKVLLNFFTGKYHQPIEEERIFMFVDMKASTATAEQLGHVAYFNLLRAYYHCFTQPIIAHEGEVYQYVGDEIVLSWKLRGNELDKRCISCFFSMQQSLQKRSQWFEQQFGIIPRFKAGLHKGKVTTGEIGDIRKEILFSGDVLNVTARIQGLCNNLGADLLVSADVREHLGDMEEYKFQFLETAELRGKQTKTAVYAVYPRLCTEWKVQRKESPSVLHHLKPMPVGVVVVNDEGVVAGDLCPAFHTGDDSGVGAQL